MSGSESSEEECNGGCSGCGVCEGIRCDNEYCPNRDEEDSRGPCTCPLNHDGEASDFYRDRLRALLKD